MMENLPIEGTIANKWGHFLLLTGNLWPRVLGTVISMLSQTDRCIVPQWEISGSQGHGDFLQLVLDQYPPPTHTHPWDRMEDEKERKQEKWALIPKSSKTEGFRILLAKSGLTHSSQRAGASVPRESSGTGMALHS
jgi:hypothetical protein